MEDLKEKIKDFIQKETEEGRFSLLNTTSSVDLIMQILENYIEKNGISQIKDGEELPRKGELIFVAAPTGAGKDSLVSRLCYRNPEKKYIELNMDIFRYYYSIFIGDKKALTDKNFAQKTNEFSYEIYYAIQEILLKEFPGSNIIITGTLRETGWVEETFERFKKNEETDYTVKIACLAVPKKESAFSVIQRYIGGVDSQKDSLKENAGTIRYTSLQYHDETFDCFPKNLEYFQKKFKDEPGKLIDCIEVYKRGKTAYNLDEETQIYSSNSKETNEEALDVVLKLRQVPYKVKYEQFALIARRIIVNKDYLKSQCTLEEVIRDLAVILEYPEIIKRINENLSITTDMEK